MGTWGTAIFSDDLAADVRADFKDYIGDGLTSEVATAALVRDYRTAIDDQDSGPPFWLSLASTQWSLGRLLPEVQTRALQVIDSGADLRRWEGDTALLAKRAKVLHTLRARLLSPQPLLRKVPRRFRDANDWPVGTVAAYRLPSAKHCLFRVIGHHEDKGGRSPIVEFLSWSGVDLPSPKEVKGLKVLRSERYGKPSQFLICAGSHREPPFDRVQLLDRRLRPSQEVDGFTVLTWKHLDKWLLELLDLG